MLYEWGVDAKWMHYGRCELQRCCMCDGFTDVQKCCMVSLQKLAWMPYMWKLHGWKIHGCPMGAAWMPHPRMSTRMRIPIMSTRMRIPLPEKCNDAEAVKSMIAQVDEFIINTTNTGVAERRGARIVHKIFNVRSKRNLGDSDGTYGG